LVGGGRREEARYELSCAVQVMGPTLKIEELERMGQSRSREQAGGKGLLKS